jgi:hypothetical protein
VTILYYDCQSRHAALVEAVKDDQPGWWQFWRIWW